MSYDEDEMTACVVYLYVSEAATETYVIDATEHSDAVVNAIRKVAARGYFDDMLCARVNKMLKTDLFSIDNVVAVIDRFPLTEIKQVIAIRNPLG